jgi:hypothetical protein
MSCLCRTLCGAMMAVCVLSVSVADAQTPVRVTVSGKANIFGAGLAVPPSPGGGGGGLPPAVIELSRLQNPKRISFSNISGTVSGWAARGGYTGPDGGRNWGGSTLIPAWRGISGARHDTATMYLVGVFLGPNGQPASAPPTLNLSNGNFSASSSPVLGQQFFVGDGKTGSGTLQVFYVPAGATRLYLGFAEGLEFRKNRLPGFYNDNGGVISATVNGLTL